MLTKRLRRAGVSAVLALLACVASVAVPAAADPHARLHEIERRQERLDARLDRINARASGVLVDIRAVDARRADIEAEVERLDVHLARLNRRISVVSDRLTETQLELAALSERLDELTARFHESMDLFQRRAVDAYKAGPTASIEGLLSAESFGELVTRYAYYESTLDTDAELLEEIDALRGDVEQRRAEVDEKQRVIAADKRRLEADRDTVLGLRTQRADALRAMELLLAQKEASLEEIEESRTRLLEVEAQLERESAYLENLLAGGSAVAGPVGAAGDGQLLWPADGAVTSEYGYRSHPVFGDRRFHAGIDIGAPYGATVIAADAGTVVFVGAMSGYGNVVVVDHGGGLATTYNHLSSFSVAEGQAVGRGSPIAAVGCTGYCTGPHLHFEVRVGGSPVDPMPYLP